MTIQNKDVTITCEYLVNPIGIQNEKVRFSWLVDEKYKKTQQEFYRIIVLDSTQNCVWDTGKVHSSQSTAVEYTGEILNSFQKYSWRVEVYVQEVSGKNIHCLKQEGSFEMGALRSQDWKGTWICAPALPREMAPLFRKEFVLEKLPECGRVYMSGLGYFEAWINGHRLGDSFLDPGWTDYNKTVLYRAFDVTNMLHTGKNVFAAELGNGWFGNDHVAFTHMIGSKPSWLSAPKLLCNIRLDGACIATEKDGTWFYAEGPVRKNSLYDGEYYDAAFEKTEYQYPEYSQGSHTWTPAEEAEPPSGILRCQIMPPIRKVRTIKPQYMEYIGEAADYSMTVDFGENFSGWVQIEAEGKAGQKIQILYGETLNQDYTVNQKNLRFAKGEDIYVFGKSPHIRHEPHFTYHGFRYAQIMLDEGVIIHEIKGCEVHTDVKKAGLFESSDRTLNQIQEAVQRTEINNLHSVPTDCPQRDERLGWMNDMTVRFEEGLYNFDLILLYEKWLQDIRDAQREDGAIPDTVPYFFGEQPARHASSVCVLLPWYLYLFYCDRQILTVNYEMMRKHVHFKLSLCGKEGLLPEHFFGDWAPPMTEAYLGWGENAVPKNITHQLLTTCYLYYDCMIMEKISDVLGKNQDAGLFCKEGKKIKENLNLRYLHGEGYYDTNAQGCNVFPLFLGIVPDGLRKEVCRHLLDNLFAEHKGHVTTGNQMTKYLFEVLNKEKLDQKAYELASVDTYPSLGYMLKQGATTIWERWENLTCNHMNSHNHPMLGAYTAWFHKGLGGITLDENREKTICLRPAVIPGLGYVRVTHRFVWGVCSSAWEKKEGRVEYVFAVPWNAAARLDLSNCSIEYNKIQVDGKVLSCSEVEKIIFTGGEYTVLLWTEKTDE